ncbi:hypothetical protein [Tunturiibacter empetritectus]|uniref:hypothetical protein n=1 Tax=Tunturiibacter empetritectus TaxID=3069691 RepID=UPI003D9BAC7F
MGNNGAGVAEQKAQRVYSALDGFRIELPSWGFANTGTRFGKFLQGGAATTIEEKFSDAAQVNALTGRARRWRCMCCGTCRMGRRMFLRFRRSRRSMG